MGIRVFFLKPEDEMDVEVVVAAGPRFCTWRKGAKENKRHGL